MRQVRIALLSLIAVAVCFAAPQQAKADGNACSYSTLAYAQLISVPLCNGSGALTVTGGGSSSFPYSATSSGQTATTASVVGVGAVYNTSAPTLTNGQFSPFQEDVNANLKVNVVNTNVNGLATSANSSPVVWASDQSPPNNITTTGSIGAVGTANGASIAVKGFTSFGISTAGTWTASAFISGSTDGGATYVTNVPCYNWTANAPFSTTGSNFTATCNVSGLSHVVVYFSAYTSGTMTIKYNLGNGTAPLSPIVSVFPGNGNGGTYANPSLSYTMAKVSAGNGWNPYVQGDTTASVSGLTATAQIVALSGTTSIYVTGYSLQLGGTTTPTFRFEYGTGTNCGTGTTLITGTFTGVSGNTYTIPSPGGNVAFTVPPGQELCAVLGGTSPTLNGFVTYAQY